MGRVYGGFMEQLNRFSIYDTMCTMHVKLFFHAQLLEYWGNGYETCNVGECDCP
jgi:hypothetical protein